MRPGLLNGHSFPPTSTPTANMSTGMEDPAGYLASTHDSVEEARRSLARQSEGLAAVRTALDVGCGPGNITATILRPALHPQATIVGCDLSPQMIEFAGSKFGNESISFRQMDVTADITSTWKKESFDMIFSFYTLHRIQDQRKVSENLFHLLKPGGRMLILFPLDVPSLKMYELVHESQRFKQHKKVIEEWLQPVMSWKDPVSFYSTALREAGFTNITSHRVHTTITYPSVDNFIGLFQSINGIKRELPAASQETFFEDCRKIVEENALFEASPAGVQYQGVMLETVATKPL